MKEDQHGQAKRCLKSSSNDRNNEIYYTSLDLLGDDSLVRFVGLQLSDFVPNGSDICLLARDVKDDDRSNSYCVGWSQHR